MDQPNLEMSACMVLPLLGVVLDPATVCATGGSVWA